uniref:Uncharacterized protein n=1 Tax=Nothobranchius furzeri TaxID=105023 RepID=A0A8C6KX98_NOTFU
MDPLKAQQLAAELEVEMMADMYNRKHSANELHPFLHLRMMKRAALGGTCCQSGSVSHPDPSPAAEGSLQ